MKNFVDFLLTKVYLPKSIPEDCIEIAFEKTIDDIKYHFPDLSTDDIKNRIITNSNELAVFLFRLGNTLHKKNLDDLTPLIHWLLKELCSCEIYFNNEIDKGFYVVHGQGTVIGSRNKIGKGFKIHHGCTIGHRRNGGGNGNVIGDDVTVYCNSSIIGELIIGNNVIIGAHVLVMENVNSNVIFVNDSSLKRREIK